MLVLRNRDPGNIVKDKDEPLDTSPRLLAVLFGRPRGGYVLAAENHTHWSRG